jgi:CheY-like chemotaxis protein
VRSAASAAEALESLAQGRFDVLVTDIGMPEADGYELLRRARTLSADLPAIALTAFARETDRRMAIEAGYQEHVGKPVEPRQLLTAIKCVMHSRQAALH